MDKKLCIYYTIYVSNPRELKDYRFFLGFSHPEQVTFIVLWDSLNLISCVFLRLNPH
jgi:hypothetical protein